MNKELQETSRTQQCTIAQTEKHHDVANEENQPGFKETDSSILLNPNQPIIKEKLRIKVRTSEALLEMMTTPTQEVCSAPVASQMTMHVGYIERMRDLAYEVAIDFINIEPNHKDHINDAELKDLNTSMIDIGHRASSNYKGLCTWEASITRANLELQTAIKAVQEEKDRRQLGATQIAICDHANITMDCNYLEEEVTEHKN